MCAFCHFSLSCERICMCLEPQKQLRIWIPSAQPQVKRKIGEKNVIGSLLFKRNDATIEQMFVTLFLTGKKKWKKLLAGFGKIQLNWMYFRCFEPFSLCLIQYVTFSCGERVGICAPWTQCVSYSVSLARSLAHSHIVFLAMLILLLPRSNYLFWRLIRTELSDRQMIHNLKAQTTWFSSFGVARKLIPLRLVKTIHFC